MSNYKLTVLVVIVVFIILFAIFGFLIAIIISVLFAIGLYQFTSYGNTTGLVKVCLKVYYSGRLSGLNHEEALIYVISKRFNSEYEQQRVISTFRILSQNNLNNIESDLRNLFYSFMIIESGAPIDNWKLQNIFFSKFDKVYEKGSFKFERFSEENHPQNIEKDS